MKKNQTHYWAKHEQDFSGLTSMLPKRRLTRKYESMWGYSKVHQQWMIVEEKQDGIHASNDCICAQVLNALLNSSVFSVLYTGLNNIT